MTIQDFDCLDEHGQMELLDGSKILAKRTYKTLEVELYALDNFFVELYYYPRFNVVTKIQAFNSTKLLDAYLPQIRINVNR